MVKTHPKYGPDYFKDPKQVDEKDFEGHQFEAGTEQREDRSGKKLDGTRIAWKTIGVVPNRAKKKKGQEEVNGKADKEVEEQLAKAEKSGAPKVAF